MKKKKVYRFHNYVIPFKRLLSFEQPISHFFHTTVSDYRLYNNSLLKMVESSFVA